jgi:hypothetical protein
MKNPLLHQGRALIVTRHGRHLSPAAAELLRRIEADFARGPLPHDGAARTAHA